MTNNSPLILDNSTYDVNVISSQKSICITILNNQTKQNYSEFYNKEDLIQMNKQFDIYPSMKEIHQYFISYFDNSIHTIKINESESSLIIHCLNFINNEEMQLILYHSNYDSRTISTHSNQSILIKRNSPTISNSTQFQYTSSVIIFVNMTLACLLIISLSILCFILSSFIHSFTPSHIVSSSDINMISNWIKPNSTFTYTLLYRASKNGDSSRKFHNLCDYISPTVTFVETTEGWKFGGYTDKCWESEIHTSDDNYKASPNAFLFSLNLKKKYISEYDNAEMFCSQVRGPTFGYGHDLSISDKCFTHASNCNSPCTFSGMEKKNEFNGGKHTFIVKELEVYLVQVKGNK